MTLNNNHLLVGISLFGLCALAVNFTILKSALRPVSIPVPVSHPLSTQDSILPKCLRLGFENDMDELLSIFKQVFVIMPAKNAGSSFEEFTGACMKGKDNWASMTNSLNHPKREQKTLLRTSFEMPTLISSHIFNSEQFVDLVKHATDDSLIIYIHRNGTDRLRSAIGQVLATDCKGKYVDHQCIVKEGELLDIIDAQTREIGKSETKILTCDAYESIEANAPNMVFMNYMQSNKMFELLAKHHCPGQKAVHKNSSEHHNAKSKTIMVELEGSTRNNGDSTVELQDWLHAKMDLIEYVHKLKADVSCQATTRKMQHDLLSCPDETMHVSSSDGSLLGFFS